MKKQLLRLALLVALGCGLTACHHESHGHEGHGHESYEHEGHGHEGHGHESYGHEGHGHESLEHEGLGHQNDEIVLSAAKAEAAGIVCETIEAAPFHSVIHTSGKVIAASCDETVVVAQTSGLVHHSDHLSEGMRVTAGATLLTLSASGIQDGDPVQRARIEYERTKREYERAKTLVADHLISEKDLAQARDEYELAHLAYDAIGEHQHNGQGTTVTQRGAHVKAPCAGYIKQCLTLEGSYVEKGQPLIIITQNQHLYLRAEVPERYYGSLGRIVSAKFRTAYSDRLYDVSEMGGKVQSYGRTAEQNQSYLPVTFEFNNTGNILQGSYADVYLIVDESTMALTVPITALTEEQGLHYIYIRQDEDCYRKQEVTLGLSDGERTVIRSGLQSGQTVVTRGAVQVKLAGATNAIPAHTHNH